MITPTKTALFCAVAALYSTLTPALANQVQVDVSIHPAGGFMNGGWGNINFNFTNTGKAEATVQQITGEWKVKGEGYSQWDQGCNVVMAPEAKGWHQVTTFMPGQSDSLASSKNGTPYVEGKILLSNGEELPYKIDIPVAKLPSPIKGIEGKYMRVDLQETTWASVKDPEKVLAYLDEAYAWMEKLTGLRPFGGATSVILEAPENPYFAYAGNPIILNGNFVRESIARFDNDLADFGWIHEMGHNFDDGIGHWYNYGHFCEFQANIKLSYAIEKMCTKDSTFKIWSGNQNKAVDGATFNDELYYGAGEHYLSSDEKLEDLASGNVFAIFHYVVRKYGWETLERYYATYVKLSKSGLQPPQGFEQNLLTFAVLELAAQDDLTAMYKEWRIPLDRAAIDALLKKYNLK